VNSGVKPGEAGVAGAGAQAGKPVPPRGRRTALELIFLAQSPVDMAGLFLFNDFRIFRNLPWVIFT
jgi:hypothetical protein